MKHKLIFKLDLNTLLRFIFIAFFQLLFFYVTLINNFDNYLLAGLFFLFSILLFLGYLIALKNISSKYSKLQLIDSLIVLTCILGGILTYFINHFVSLGAVISSAIVGLTGGLLAKLLNTKEANSLALAFYCGSYVGMSSINVLENIFIVALAAFFTGLIFILTKGIFKGYGGKLGTMAFIGVVILIIFMKVLGG